MDTLIDRIPLVSVRLMTYNHEEYIAQAIESCLMQICDFPFEVVIGDDFSTDATLQICLKYENQYPEVIKVLKRQKRDEYHIKRQTLGRLYNFVDIINNCKGRYIALLDGDDYWTDPLKLQKQYDMLEANSALSGCYHKIEWQFDDSGPSGKRSNNNDPPTTTLRDVIEKGWFIRTASLFYHNMHLPTEFSTFPVGDYPLALLIALKGNIGFINETMAVYRNNGKGVSSKLKPTDDVATMRKKALGRLQVNDYFKSTSPRVYSKLYDKKMNRIVRATLSNSLKHGIWPFLSDFLFFLRKRPKHTMLGLNGGSHSHFGPNSFPLFIKGIGKPVWKIDN